LAEILRKESVEQCVAHTNTCPAEPDENGCCICKQENSNMKTKRKKTYLTQQGAWF
jgi:hypothetical protein